VIVRRVAKYEASSPTMYSGTMATRPASTRVVTRYWTEGTAITSRASTSSEIRMAPSCAVKPQPTVAASARPATIGEISRVLK
jgi:hypothetical protein